MSLLPAAAPAVDEGPTLAARLRAHAGSATHLYGHAMRGMADDLEAGGPVREVCAGFEDAPPGAVLQLRLLAGVFRLVLTDQAPELTPFYPCLGGLADPAGAWPVMRRVIAEHVTELHAALVLPPQTNEVGRSAALLAGLFDLAGEEPGRPMRVLELGASAGLNLLLDRFCLAGRHPDSSGWTWGPEASPVRFSKAITGPIVPRPLRLIEGRGCDLAPVDAATPEGAVLLRSFVWPFDLHRHARLDAVLSLAAEHPPVVDAAPASVWLPARLAATPEPVLPVVWHSISQLYWPPAETEALEQALSAAGAERPVAEVSLEYARASRTGDEPQLITRLWRPGTAEPRVLLLGAAHHHASRCAFTPGSQHTPETYAGLCGKTEAIRSGRAGVRGVVREDAGPSPAQASRRRGD